MAVVAVMTGSDNDGGTDTGVNYVEFSTHCRTRCRSGTGSFIYLL